MKKSPRNQSHCLWISIILAVGSLAACGGGETNVPNAASTTPTFVMKPYVPVVTTASLRYAVFDSTNVGTGVSAPPTATVTSNDAVPINITFLPDAQFSTGLLISRVNTGSPSWNNGVGAGGVTNTSFPSGSGGGLLSQGNFFVFCSAGIAATIADAAAVVVSKAGAKVAVSENFVPMAVIPPTNGRPVNRFDCTNTPPTATTFGDASWDLSNTSDALSPNGYQPSPGVNPTYKRRAYQITLNGQTQYVVVALDIDSAGNASASVLYQYN